MTTLEGHLHRTSPQKLHQSAAQQLAIKIQQLQDESDPDADSAFVDTPNHHLSLQVLHHLQSLRVQHRPGIHPGHDPDETREQCQEMADQLAGYARDINIDSHQAWSRNLTGRDDGGPEQDPRDPLNLWQKSWSPGLGKFLVHQSEENIWANPNHWNQKDQDDQDDQDEQPERPLEEGNKIAHLALQLRSTERDFSNPKALR